eukprot:m.37381 g.37381  ORF g.37381 m.37381 type:complete len:71 (-) comp10144_c0_seq10:17-229(-)
MFIFEMNKSLKGNKEQQKPTIETTTTNIQTHQLKSDSSSTRSSVGMAVLNASALLLTPRTYCLNTRKSVM